MEVLFRWLVDNGWNPSVVTYVGAAVFLLIMITIYIYIRGDKRS
ncbi:hypothetical protein [Marinobacterium aestuariivivens]|uniref:DUF3149 domain-containing protein n=1 Tax=Marinobacterium aestuariivivens TaxID=1698799 RepID=A0ABW1ZZ11_9GAMM